jgi:hypothetical protein
MELIRKRTQFRSLKLLILEGFFIMLCKKVCRFLEPLHGTVKGAWQLDDSIQSTVMAMVSEMASEIERGLISKRTKESLAVKKLSGIKLADQLAQVKASLINSNLRSKHFTQRFKPEVHRRPLPSNGSNFIQLYKEK